MDALNEIHLLSFNDNALPDGCAQLIIADPPYFEVRGEFDFAWSTFDDYLFDVQEWAKECNRLLADNGTLFWYGPAKKIAYTQIIFDKYFTLLNNLTWNKGSFMGLEKWAGMRCFAPCTERILMYSKEQDGTGYEQLIDDHLKPVHPFAIYLRAEFSRAGVSNKDIAQLFPSASGRLTGCVSNWTLGENVISPDQYETIRQYLGGDYLAKPYDHLREQYETIRQSIEAQRRPFDNSFELQEVLNFSNESEKTGAKYDHETVKPETLTRALILTCSRPGDLVVVPFAGSGTECAMSAKEGRRFVGYEINPKHVATANRRAARFIQQKTLFE